MGASAPRYEANNPTLPAEEANREREGLEAAGIVDAGLLPADEQGPLQRARGVQLSRGRVRPRWCGDPDVPPPRGGLEAALRRVPPQEEEREPGPRRRPSRHE